MAKVTLNPQHKSKGVTFISSKRHNVSLIVNVILVSIIVFLLVRN